MNRITAEEARKLMYSPTEQLLSEIYGLIRGCAARKGKELCVQVLDSCSAHSVMCELQSDGFTVELHEDNLCGESPHMHIRWTW